MLGGNYARFLGMDWSLDQTLEHTSRALRITNPDLSSELSLAFVEIRARESRAEALRNLGERVKNVGEVFGGQSGYRDAFTADGPRRQIADNSHRRGDNMWFFPTNLSRRKDDHGREDDPDHTLDGAHDSRPPRNG